MLFSQLPDNHKLEYTKREFTVIIKSIFENPEVLKTYIASNALTTKQAKAIFQLVNTFNSKDCICCRKFDTKKIITRPIPEDLTPVLDIAIAALRADTRNY
jgi:hypothetical protein